MPNDASGKGSADAASKSRLTKTQLDAILSLAAAGDVEPKAEAAQPDARGAAGAAHVAIWDTVNEVRLSGANAPTTETLAAFLRAHPHCVVFNGQKPSRRAATGAATERSGLDRLVVASGAPPSLGERPPTPREHASHGGEEPAKRSMYTPEQLQRLQAEFEACELPSKERREALAAELDIPTRSVQIWFQNRRQRVKSASHGAKRSGGSGGPRELTRTRTRTRTRTLALTLTLYPILTLTRRGARLGERGRGGSGGGAAGGGATQGEEAAPRQEQRDQRDRLARHDLLHGRRPLVA